KDEDAEDELSGLRLDGPLLENFADDHGARDRDGRAEEDGLDGGPAEDLPERDAHPHEEADLEKPRQPRGRQDAHERRDAELEADREHDEDDAELGHRLDAVEVRSEGDRQVRADEQARDEVAEDGRLVELARDDAGDCGHPEHHSEIGDQALSMHRVLNYQKVPDDQSESARGSSLPASRDRVRSSAGWPARRGSWVDVMSVLPSAQSSASRTRRRSTCAASTCAVGSSISS